MIGQVIGHYRILEKLGAGGMGEVYRAEDLTLKRHVAFKVLPPEVSDSPEKLERFQREAETLAALDHPNIVTLFSVEQAQPETTAPGEPPTVHFLTMQLVEGKPLSKLIPEDGLSIERALQIGISLTEALRAAHEKGVIHRDLKPANVMLDQEGRIKVLDFGLAKLFRADLDDQASVVATEVMTQEGVVLGTIPYMSPEQLQGKTVDQRTDIFSLGILLQEMLCGQRPFQASNTAALMSSMLRDPPIVASNLKPDLPEKLDRILQRCLEKDRLLRYQSADELWPELKEAQNLSSGAASSEIEAAVERALAKAPSDHDLTTDPEPAASPAGTPLRSPGRRWIVVLITLLAGLAALSGYLILDQKNDGPKIPAPSAQLNHRQLTSQPGTEQYPSLAPDGQWVVYSAEGPQYQDIYLQSVSGQKPFNLTEESGADNIQPTFSPDGNQIAFRSSRDGGGIFVMGRTGEAVRRVSRKGYNPTWSPDGARIAYSNESVDLNPLNWAGQTEVWMVDLSTGNEVQLPIENAVQPVWSPDGQRIAYVARMGEPTRMDLATIPINGGEAISLSEDETTEWSPEWSSDGKYLYFASDRSGSMNLWRIGVEQTTGQATGPAEALTTPATYLAHPSLSADGERVAYSSVLMTQNVQRIDFEPTTATVGEQITWVTTGSILCSSVDPSPNGEWIAFYTRSRPEGDLYLARTDGSGLRQLTSDSAIDRVPRWSPSGDWIAFFSDRGGSLQLWRIRPDGSDLQQLTEHPENASLAAWSPSGTQIAVLAGLGPKPQTIIFDPDRPWSGQELQTLPNPETENLRFVATSWSSDGAMLAGQNGFTQEGIFVYSFASGSYRRLTDFGEWPVWLPDSRDLMFVSDGSDFYVLALEDPRPEKIFSVSRDVIGPPRLSKDGRQLLFTRRVTEADIWLLTSGE
jgi:Tol biopolymer transport system component